MKEIATTILRNFARVLGVLALSSLFFSNGVVSAQEINLTLQDAPLTVLKDSSVTKGINGIPGNTPGAIHLDIKWHVMTLIPNTFNMLKIELLHGSNVLFTRVCYSVHSGRNPKCYVNQVVSQAEANASGSWKLRVSNNTDHDVNGFNILKEGTDLNPTVSHIESTFRPDCSTSYLTLSGGVEVDIGPFSTVEKEFYGVLTRAGEVHIKAKWHSLNSFNKLKVEVLFNGTVVKTDEGYSIHSDHKGKLDRISILFNKDATTQLGTWKLRIINVGGAHINNFGIEKGGDLNPFVPGFRSTYKPCS